MRSFRLLLLALTATLASCATTTSPPQQELKPISLGIVDKDSAPVQATVAGQVFAVFPIMPGALSGRPSQDNILELPARFGEPVEMPLTRLASLVAPRAAPLSGDAGGLGLTVVPADRRFARVGTFFQRSIVGDTFAGASFIDERTRENLMLVYFDGPCSVGGAVRVGGIDIETRFEIPAAGMHWIRTRKGTPTRWSLELANPQTPVALVTTQVF